MTEMINTAFVQTGNVLSVDSGSSVRHGALPVGTYMVFIDPNAGPKLRRVPDMRVGTAKVYGGRAAKVDKAFAAYRHMRAENKSTGVLLSGPKGLGKSVVLRQIAERALVEGLPVVRVESGMNGIAPFLASLGPAVVLFDEFEKTYPVDEGDYSAQDQFLALFDGTSPVSQMYVLTTNSTSQRDLTPYLVDRPGRIRYHIQLAHPTPDEVREYLTDRVPGINQKTLEAIVAAQLTTPLVYDQLAAIATEIAIQGDQAGAAEIFEDLNIERPDQKPIDLRVKTSSGITVERLHPVLKDDNLLLGHSWTLVNEKGQRVKSLHYGDSDLDIRFQLEMPVQALRHDGARGLVVDASMVRYNQSEEPLDLSPDQLEARLRSNKVRSNQVLLDGTEQPAPTLGDLLGTITEVTMVQNGPSIPVAGLDPAKD